MTKEKLRLNCLLDVTTLASLWLLYIKTETEKTLLLTAGCIMLLGSFHDLSKLIRNSWKTRTKKD